MQNVRLEESQAGIKFARRNINNLRYADDTTVMAESEEELCTASTFSPSICHEILGLDAMILDI